MQAIKENKDNEQQSKNKKRMDIIREKLNNFLIIESKEIRKSFYNIEKRTNNYIQYKIIHKTLHKLLYTLFISIFNQNYFIKIINTTYNFFYLSIV